MFTVKSSVTGTFWHIMANGQVVHGAPKRGDGSATKAQMIDWANELNAEVK